MGKLKYNWLVTSHRTVLVRMCIWWRYLAPYLWFLLFRHDVSILLLSWFSSNRKGQEGNYIHMELFNNTPHLIKLIFMSTIFMMVCKFYNDNALIQKWETIDPILYHMIPLDWCQNNQYVINFNIDDMTPKFKVFKNTYYINLI